MKCGWAMIGLSILWTGLCTAAIQQGQYELGMLVTVSNSDYNNGSSRDIFSADLDGAYFVTDNLSVGLDFGGDWREISGSLKVDQYRLGAKAKYHVYIQNQTVPYFGAMFGLANSETTSTVGSVSSTAKYDGSYYGALFGARMELNRSNDLYMEYQLRWYSGSIKDDLGLEKEGKLLIGILHQFN